MSTILFDSPIFGPVHSRRLGVSLGINLLPTDRKICSFDCVYCECGYNNAVQRNKPSELPTRQCVEETLRSKLLEMAKEELFPDVITFAGNGEPTLHPDFAQIIDDTLAIRDQLCPKDKVAVLSNASQLSKPEVVEALKRVDDNILKLDSGCQSDVTVLDRPNYSYSLKDTVQQLKLFNGNLIVQTMFVRGEIDGFAFDNTNESSVAAWLDCLRQIKPKSLMVYTIDRETPLKTLYKVPLEELEQLADKARLIVGSVSVSG